MFQIYKIEPTFFIESKKLVKLPFISSAWNEIGKTKTNFKSELREYILLEEQGLRCAYCEQEIESDGDSSNTDHFKTRSLFPKETLNYNNLLVSCKSKVHCENIKDNFGLISADYKKIINPVIENPDEFFEYGINGTIIIKDKLIQIDKDKAKFTIEVFKLDNKSLEIDRQKIGNSLNYYYELEYDNTLAKTKIQISRDN